MELLERCKKMQDWLREVRRDFHMHPELGFEEIRTGAQICLYLDEMAVPYKKGVAKTGIVADIKGKDENFTIALRADIDALPILEANDVPYKSKNPGKMHACGHDAHTTILLGVAKAVHENILVSPCNLRLLFQPAEETTGGAAPMIAEGCLEGVDAVIGLHVDPFQETGGITIQYGAMNASSDMFTINIKGRSIHGAYPADGVDAVLIAAHVVSALQSVVSRNTDAREALVLTIGTINGGTARNIVCGSVQLTGVIRTLNPQVREHANKRVKEIVEGVASSFGGTGEYIRIPSYTSLINHDAVVDLIKQSGEELLGKEKVVERFLPGMGVEDFSFFVEAKPGAFFNLGVGSKAKGIGSPAHNEHFNIDEDALPIGVSMQCMNILKIYEALKDGKNLWSRESKN